MRIQPRQQSNPDQGITFSTWLLLLVHGLFSSLRETIFPRPRRARPNGRVRPNLEGVEDRTMPSILTVFSLGDTFVSNDRFQEDRNFGTWSFISASYFRSTIGGNPDQITNGYLAFDLSGLPQGAQLTHARLTLNPAGADVYSFGTSLVTFRLAADNWAETTLTYNTQPAISDDLGAVDLRSIPTHGPLVLDLPTSAVAREAAGDHRLSIAIALITDQPRGRQNFTSKEDPNQQLWPRLDLEYTLLLPPEAPTALTAAVPSSSQVNLAWSDNAATETGFKLQRSTNPAFVGATEITIGRPDVTGYSDTTVAAGTQYFYRVLAFNGAGQSAFSNAVSVTTPPVPGQSVIIDNNSPDAVHTTGWRRSSAISGYVGSDYIYAQRGGQSVTVNLGSSYSGKHAVALRWTAAPNRSQRVRVEITHRGGTTVKYVNQQRNGGVWVALGTYDFTGGGKLTIRSSSTGVTVFDAFKLDDM
jgi:hypothetical protein